MTVLTFTRETAKNTPESLPDAPRPQKTRVSFADEPADGSGPSGNPCKCDLPATTTNTSTTVSSTSRTSTSTNTSTSSTTF